jgi:hypothetical protein
MLAKVLSVTAIIVSGLQPRARVYVVLLPLRLEFPAYLRGNSVVDSWKN